jgi:acetyl-CoA carboxylase biotin carboxyl carrier protein
MKKPPAARTPDYDDILAIARLIESGSRFTEFRLRSGDIEVEVKREGGAPRAAAPAAGATPSLVAPAQAGGQFPDLPPGTHVIRSPMVGTFYRAPEPGAKPFVEPGTKVRPDSIVCIIEVMKLMNSVEAGIKGTVTHVLVENGAVVEPGQALVAIQP